VLAPDPAAREEGSSVVEFALVTVLLLFLFLVVVQVGLLLHTRTLLVAAAAEGARYGADADRTDDDGAVRALQVVHDALPGAVDASARAVPRTAPDLVDIEVTGTLPVVLLPGGAVHLTVHAHAVEEGG
jgi:Flp pilus assembly protein TadG